MRPVITIREFDPVTKEFIRSHTSFSFGNILAGGTSGTKVFDFVVNGVTGVTNFKLKIIDSEGIEVSPPEAIISNNVANKGNFGFETSSELSVKSTFSKFFGYFNVWVGVPMRSPNVTNYVYLNLSPGNYEDTNGVIKYGLKFSFRPIESSSSSSSSSSSCSSWVSSSSSSSCSSSSSSSSYSSSSSQCSSSICSSSTCSSSTCSSTSSVTEGYRVTGSGLTDVDGLYCYVGTHNGRYEYKHETEDYRIRWDGTVFTWTIAKDRGPSLPDFLYYIHTVASSSPPLTGWGVGPDGTPPAPTLSTELCTPLMFMGMGAGYSSSSSSAYATVLYYCDGIEWKPLYYYGESEDCTEFSPVYIDTTYIGGLLVLREYPCGSNEWWFQCAGSWIAEHIGGKLGVYNNNWLVSEHDEGPCP